MATRSQKDQATNADEQPEGGRRGANLRDTIIDQIGKSVSDDEVRSAGVEAIANQKARNIQRRAERRALKEKLEADPDLDIVAYAGGLGGGDEDDET